MHCELQPQTENFVNWLGNIYHRYTFKMSMLKRMTLYLMFMFPQPAFADIGIALGLNITYDFDVGITLKALSSDKAEGYVIALGTSYYPFAEVKTGIDIGLGGTGFSMFFLYGVDIYRDAAYMSFGFFNSDLERD